MDKIRFFFIALLGMGAAHLSAQTADSTQTSPWTTEGFAGIDTKSAFIRQTVI